MNTDHTITLAQTPTVAQASPPANVQASVPLAEPTDNRDGHRDCGSRDGCSTIAISAALLFAAFIPNAFAGAAVAPDQIDLLASGFDNVPMESRIRSYWWWLNGNATKAAITRDLEEMKAKGLGGALICDAGGAEQDGNDKVPAGPAFLSAEWRELYKHALREADRLGMEMSLNIQSGWNLGGPMVTAEDAPKKLVWTETRAQGPSKFEQKLAMPRTRDDFYQDIAVIAYRKQPNAKAPDVFAGVASSSAQPNHGAELSVDGSTDSFWVSKGSQSGEGPARERAEWLQLNFTQPITANSLAIVPRAGYGPHEGELRVSDDGRNFRAVTTFTARQPNVTTTVNFDEVRATHFRIVFFSSFDPRHPDSPRNVQVAEVSVSGADGRWPGAGRRQPIQNWEQKALHRSLHFSAPDTTPLFQEFPAEPGEEDALSNEIVDLSSKLEADGTLRWNVPDGDWEILRFGCTLNDRCRVSTSSDGWKGYAVNPFDPDAFRRYWDAVVEPLIEDAGPLAGRTLKYLHTDSWEIGVANWTPALRQEFRQRRGYDLLPFLPVVAGRIVDSREESNRFLHDLRRTLGDLAIGGYYRPFRAGAHRHNMLIHPESGGPHAVPIDAQQCLGFNDAPMSEFWAWSWRHRVGDQNRFFVKQPASAAHTYGRRLVLAEGFTTIGPHWQERLWDNLKPSFDHALCEGLNMLVWHAFVCSPDEMGIPGQQYFAGTHLNPLVTWWEKSGPFFDYLNRAQFMLQQGLFVADVAYYYGDHVPNFSQLKSSDPAKILPGYDYDVVTEEVILTRMSVRDGRIVLPDGMSYRLLVLPERTIISLPALRKIKQLVEGGATVIGPKPEKASGLSNAKNADAEVRQLAEQLWGELDGKSVTQRKAGKGRVIWGRTARDVLLADGIAPDVEFSDVPQDAMLNYIHRRDGDTDIYFVANRSNRWEEAKVTFRVSGKVPELWDALTGERQPAQAFTQANGRTTLPLEFAPCGSMFVVFRQPAPAIAAGRAVRNSPKVAPRHDITGPWTVKFDPKWGGPESAQFNELVSWSERPEEGIKFFSGTAVYQKTFDVPAKTLPLTGGRVWLDLGDVHQLAEVRLNRKNLGVVWTMPFRVDVTGVLKSSGNQLEIEVVNFWPNRIIGDDFLPPEDRFTRTNIRKLTKATPLETSGLLGPVRILTAE